MATTLLHYLYRDADNYKAWGAIALAGNMPPARWKPAIAKLDAGEFFVAEQLGVPPLYHALHKWSDGPTSADHCWHTFVDIEAVDKAGSDAYCWGDAETFVARLLAVDEWRGELSPHFWLVG